MPRKVSAGERLVRAAEAELIANHGHLEMSAVAKRASASVGLAYHHFGSKTGLVAAVVERFYEPIREIAFGDKIPLNLEWGEREKARAKALIDHFYDHPLAPLIAGRLAREPEVLDIERAHMDALLDAGARNISQGQKLGVVHPDLAPEATVAMLMGGLRLAIDRAILAEKRPAREALLAQIWQLCQGALHLRQPSSADAKGLSNAASV